MNFGNIYLIELKNHKEKFYKIGITVHTYCRFYELIKHGYNIKIIFMMLKLPYLMAFKFESFLHSKFESYIPITNFGGHTECFKNIHANKFKKYLINSFGNNYKTISNLKIDWRKDLEAKWH